MKIGISPWYISKYFEYEELCPKLKSIGYDCLDVPLTKGWRERLDIYEEPASVWREYWKRRSDIIKDAGLEVSQTHASYPVDFISSGSFGQAELDQFRKEIESAAIIESPYIVIHPINIARGDERKEEDFEKNMICYGKIVPILKEYGVKLAVENMWAGASPFFIPTGCSSVADMIRYIDGVGDEAVACLDTGHMNLFGFPVGEAVRVLGKRLEVLHIHDNFGYCDSHCVPCDGTIDWNDFANALRETGYKGVLSLEIDSIARTAKIDPELVWSYADYAYHAVSNIRDLALGK